MIASTASTSGKALGALALVGGNTQGAKVDRASSGAAQEFAALLGNALHAHVARPAKIALVNVADAALDAAQAGSNDAGATEDTANATGSEANAMAAAAANATASGTATAAANATATAAATAAANDAANVAAMDASADRETSAADETSSAVEGTAGAGRSREARRATHAARTARSAIPEVSDRSTDALDSDFSARLTRVLDRMKEAGYDVELVETTRTTDRQQALFAQGRTAEGPVVTWTLDSRHLTGHAADVRVNGEATGPGYAVLHRIADEEGLRTLGMRDPGHLELPRTTADAKDGAAARRGGRGLDVAEATRQGMDAPATLARPARLATTARVAEVARVARPAEVARPARVAAVALPGSATITGRAAGAAAVAQAHAGAATHTSLQGAIARGNAAAQALAARVAAAVAKQESAAGTGQAGTVANDATIATRTVAVGRVETRGTDGEAHGDAQANTSAGADARGGAASQGSQSADPRVARAARLRRQVEAAVGVLDDSRASALAEMRDGSRDGRSGDASGFGETVRTGAMHRTSAGGPVSAAGQLAAARAADLLAARDAAPAPTVGELRLAMDPARDGLSEIRLAMDGAALDATLRTSDVGVARGLQGEVASLARALEKHGFDTARVAISLDAAQQSRAAALDTVAASEATARDRSLRGDGSAAREGREAGGQHTASDTHRDQQHQRRFGGRRAN